MLFFIKEGERGRVRRVKGRQPREGGVGKARRRKRKRGDRGVILMRAAQGPAGIVVTTLPSVVNVAMSLGV